MPRDSTTLDSLPADALVELLYLHRFINRRAIKPALHGHGLDATAAGVDAVIAYLLARPDLPVLDARAAQLRVDRSPTRPTFDLAAEARQRVGVVLPEHLERIASRAGVDVASVRSFLLGDDAVPLSTVSRILHALGAVRVVFANAAHAE